MGVLRARGLGKAYGSKQVLSGIELDLEAGECLGVAGPPGSGRTTLLRILATLVSPTSGTLEIDGIDATTRVHEARSRLAFVGEPAGRGRRLRASEHLAFCHRARHGRDADPGAIDSALEIAGLPPGATEDALPSAARRRLGLAFALVCRPRVVFLDEGREAGDEVIVTSMLAELGNRGIAVVAGLDEMGTLHSACSRVVSLREGRLRPRPVGRRVVNGAATVVQA